MTTLLDLGTLSLKDIGALGIGQSISPDDTADMLATANMMLGEWQGERLSVYHLVETVIQSTGAQSYTVGPGGNFNTPAWPFKINAAYARLNAGSPNPIDYPVKIIGAREDYARIALKSLVSFPSYAFYDSTFPLGNLFMFPVPNSSFELHIVTLEALPQFVTPADDINLPPEYMAAIRYNLAIWLCGSYQLDPPRMVEKLAGSTKRVIKRMNLQIQSMSMPRGLATKQRYNIYSDRPY
ncbi:hypothetical protein [Burkholderia vietnamiensis]|uniref:hypothetical protein n=1 Tax=Burkholderia vietnamiensis TaxID=60552 RepID=UPI000841DD0D|nr:hypothetical protein [Burkholderia vietnamiensis]AOJ99926.1 hypothetical protein WK23_15530 [Burkholderia vietnamiensis]